MIRILSGMQPTNQLHLGNYLGALKNWVALQDKGENLFCVVDLHAITQPQDPAVLAQSTREIAAAYIAAGIDIEKSIIFAQSHVSAHAELAWILGCFTPMGWLNRMTQFKDKAGKDRESAPLGLYGYPVLMAADILTYKATHVPVGEDQKQHLELARDIAGAFNRRYDVEFFPLPEPQILGEATRVMSLRDGTKKMSKSDLSDMSRINMTDTPELIAQKVRKAKTDPAPLPANPEELEGRPEADNLLTLYAALTDGSKRAAVARFAGTQFSLLKAELTEAAVETLGPIAARMNELMGNTAAIDAILRDGAEKADAIAQPILAEAKALVGFLPK
ncbi:MAG: trpS [Rhodospirillales bacterium]|nr:trpS [Rhodospirillales bacterium]